MLNLEDNLSKLNLQATKKVEEKKERYPSLRWPPYLINPKAQEKYWGQFVKKYSKVWKNCPTNQEAWACCVAIWKNYCFKRRIMPFKEMDENTENKEISKGIESTTKESLIRNIESARKNQVEVATKLINRGIEVQAIHKAYKETFDSILTPKSGIFVIETQKILRLYEGDSLKSKDIQDWLKKRSFVNMRGVYKRNIRNNTDLHIKFDKETEDLILVYQNTLTDVQLRYILSLDEEKIKDINKVKKLLATFWKKLMRTIK